MSDPIKAIEYVLVNEGPYSNDPDDSGGATNFGLTKVDVAAFRGVKVSSLSNDDIKHLSKDEAILIYKARYWSPLRGDQIVDQTVATAILDVGVLYGVSTVTKYVQNAINALGGHVAVDSSFGALTVIGLNKVDPKAFIQSLHGQVIDRINAIVFSHPKDAKFRKGWKARADRLLTIAIA